ncbi:PTS mannose/fructose/sorbose/N-acetylgalactosamine transporter subunit IIC [Isobaculum melis]|uniref:PTS system, mannose-specific IIC component n=1 Tax=Isobaculum melis TaxID=142588 RepID=A0A1H9SWZ0_9LACT|nr:PTS sugar transporter subunit IIC [Isobaculum melis]SER88893.1 PTS system, mannose-specific IIC component [Isobaculum melis]
MFTAISVALWAGICGIDDMSTQMIRRPLLIATVVGLLMGDLQSGLIIGATLEVMWMGIGNVGAYSAPDIISGTAIGTALGILSGGGTATAVALAVPTSLLAQQLLILYRSSIVALNPIAKKWAATGDFSKIFKINAIPMIFVFLIRALPTFLAIYFGADVIETAVKALPEGIMNGLSVAGKIIPAVGIALLMQMMLKKAELWVFLLVGFILAIYLDLSVLPITFIALPFALIYDMASREKVVVANTTEVDEMDEDGGYDL